MADDRRPRETGAGGSAWREYARRRAVNEWRVRERQPQLGGLLLAVQSEPSTNGADGDGRVCAVLDGITSDCVRVLHDRRIPGSRTKVDHLVVTGAGVYVIHARRYPGRVERHGRQVLVADRDRSRLVEGVARQCTTLRQVLDDGTPLFPVLCFVDADWALFTRPFTITDTLVCWPWALRQRIQAGKPVDPSTVASLAARLESVLPPA